MNFSAQAAAFTARDAAAGADASAKDAADPTGNLAAVMLAYTICIRPNTISPLPPMVLGPPTPTM